MIVSAEPRPLLIVVAGRPVEPLRRHGGFGHWIRVAAGLGRREATVVDVEAGAPLPRPAGFAGIIVSGSAAMVTERLDWSERAAGWLREAAHAGLPLFGICYGHQLLAHALGGEVGDHPRGREMGTVEVACTPGCEDDPLFAALPPRFAAQATHLQSVLRAPPETVLLAASDHDGCHAFRWREHVWGVQFHPEFSAMHMRGYIRARADQLRGEGTDPQALAAAVRAAPHARRALRRFARRARTLSADRTIGDIDNDGRDQGIGG
ncbi:glutamine amidotransferase [Luteimonas sp. SJ-92]|uniref:Glutamine amidotransferase n=1 Tax=Luteimonas salinisoli TaxID=2752307 RepID=A0A853J9M6_9GAMM|nr:glutamine amidotransferase [Luteimonas salinisoli]NZA25871.1 glutamine amidotransferase [Luteimonas salinisoli]